MADAEISSEQSAGFIVSQMKAYGNETQEFADHTVNAINNISNNMAVSSADLQGGISKVSSALSAAGNSFEESLALITASSEILHNNANKASRGTRTISANFAKAAATAGELSYTVNGASRSISLLDETTGDMLNTFQIYQKLYTHGWKEMTNAEKDNLAITYAGKNQMEVFLATMNNFSAAQRALGLAIDDENSAWIENEKYLNSIEAQMNLLKSQFQNMVLGDGGLEQITINVLKLTNGIISLTNTFGGLKTIATALIGLGIAHRVETLMKNGISTSKIIMSLANTLDYLKTVSVIAKDQQLSLSKAFVQTVTSAQLASLAIAGITLALTAGIAVYSAYKAHQDKVWQSAVEQSTKAKDSFEQSKQTLELANTVLSDENAELDTVRSALSSVTSEYDKQLDLITDVNEQRKQAIEYLKAETESYDKYMKTQASKVWEDNQAGYETAMKRVSKADTTGFFSSGANTPSLMGMGLSAQEMQQINVAKQNAIEARGIENVKRAYSELNDVLRNVAQTHKELDEDAISKITLSISKNNQTISELDEKYAEELQLIETVNVSMAKYGYVIEQTAKGNFTLKASEEEAKEVIADYNKQTGVQLDTLSKLCDQYGFTAEDIQEYIEKHPELQDEYENDIDLQVAAAEALAEEVENRGALATSYSAQVDAMKGIQSAYSDLIAIQDDYNDNGHLTAENLERLNQLNPQYLKALVMEGNQMSINTSILEEQFEAQKQLALINVDLAKQLAVTELCEQTLGKEVDATNVYLGNAQTEASELSAKYNELAQSALKAGRMVQTVRMTMKGSDLAEFEKNLNEIERIFDTQKDAIKSTELAHVTSDKNKARSSGSSAKDSKDAWLEAYKAEKDALDSLYKTGVINAEEYAVKLQALGDKYLLDSAEHQKKYAEQIHSLYEEIYKSLQKSAKDALDEMKDTHKKAEDSLKSQHEEQEKAIKRQIELLKRQKDAIKDSYDAQIEALKREREEYENQIKLMKLKEELAKAEQTYQYVMDESGRFNWVKDQKAVDEKQEELYEEKLKQSYERQLQALEDARDTAVKQYEQQIQDLEDYYDRVKDANDRAEEQLKAHNDEIEKLYEKATSDYETYATMLANGQLDTIANENSNWATRLNNLANFVNNYNALMNKLGDGSTGNGANASFKGGTSYTPTSSSGGGTKSKVKPDGVKYSKGSFSLADKAKIRASLGKHASGVASVDSDEMALVGDSPNQELVIGSKLNGIPLSLNAGSGVVNAKSTKTFAGLLNSLPKLSNNYSTTNTSNQQVIHVDNINLPQVTNGEEFIDYLQNFDIDMIQRSF